jgi:hypothetical protein
MKVALQHQAGGYLAADHPKLRVFAQHNLRQPVVRRIAATRVPSQVKDSIADLISSARVNCAVRQAFCLYLPTGGILELSARRIDPSGPIHDR